MSKTYRFNSGNEKIKIYDDYQTFDENGNSTTKILPKWIRNRYIKKEKKIHRKHHYKSYRLKTSKTTKEYAFLEDYEEAERLENPTKTSGWLTH